MDEKFRGGQACASPYFPKGNEKSNRKPSDFPLQLPGESDREWGTRAEKCPPKNQSRAGKIEWKAWIKIIKRNPVVIFIPDEFFDPDYAPFMFHNPGATYEDYKRWKNERWKNGNFI